jgi:small subunit ribosomal protein S7
MSRRRRAERRPIAADPIHRSETIARFINKVMQRGKKGVARRIVYGALDLFAQRTKVENVPEAFERVLENAMPSLEVKSRRIGGATYQVPVEINAQRREALGMRWLIKHAQAKAGRAMIEKLARELVDTYNNEGTTVKKKDDTHRMAEANKAFAHYRW